MHVFKYIRFSRRTLYQPEIYTYPDYQKIKDLHVNLVCDTQQKFRAMKKSDIHVIFGPESQSKLCIITDRFSGSRNFTFRNSGVAKYPPCLKNTIH